MKVLTIQIQTLEDLSHLHAGPYEFYLTSLYDTKLLGIYSKEATTVYLYHIPLVLEADEENNTFKLQHEKQLLKEMNIRIIFQPFDEIEQGIKVCKVVEEEI